MAAATGRHEERVQFRYRRLAKPEELRAAEELQRETLGMEGELPVGVTVQRAALDHGGFVLGAFADIYLAGVLVSVLGWDGSRLYQNVLTTVVRPAYQNHGVGERLLGYLREEVLQQGLGQVVGCFDPLSSRAANLTVARLGARPEKYRAHYYGTLDSAADRDLETDRLEARWELGSPEVAGRLGGARPDPRALEERAMRSAAIIETTVSDEGFRIPATVAEPDRDEAHLEIPFDLGAVREHDPARLRVWRHAVRDGFRAAFDLGFQVEDFVVRSIEHERRSFYLLRRASPPPPAATAPPA